MAMSSLPIGSQATFSLSRRAIKSVPPVVAPWRKMTPMEPPMDSPPKIQASMGSMGWKVYHAVSRSMNTDEMNMA